MATSASSRRAPAARPLSSRNPPGRTTAVGPSGIAFALMAVTALVLGTILGLAATAWTLAERFDPAAVKTGAWIAWPKVGTVGADPYARAIMAQSGEVPMVAAEGLLLIASGDQSGLPLSGRCEYRITGRTLPARLWTLSVASPDGQPLAGPLGRSGFASTDLLRDGDGRFIVDVSHFARPGNWLASPDGAFRLVLHLYEGTLSSTASMPERPLLPPIDRIGCRS